MPAIHSLTLALIVAAPPGPPPAPAAAQALSPSTVARHLVPEKPTVFVFLKPSSRPEQAFLGQIRTRAGVKAGIREVPLKTGDEPVARQFEIASTPAALVYDRRGRFVGRSSSADEVAAMVRKAAQVMRIDWAEPGDLRLAEMEKILGRSANSGIMRTMS